MARPRHLLRTLTWAAAAVAAASLLLLLSLWLLAAGHPSWYDPPNATQRPTIEQAQTLENAVGSQLSLARPAPSPQGAEWSVSISQDDANAWLGTRLPAWISSRGTDWPAGASGVQARFNDSGCTLAATIEAGGLARVVTIAIEPRIASDGSLSVLATGAAVGRLPIPTTAALTRIKGGDTLRAILCGERPLMKDPVIKLEDGRRVRLLGIRMRAGRVEVSCRTELPRR